MYSYNILGGYFVFIRCIICLLNLYAKKHYLNWMTYSYVPCKNNLRRDLFLFPLALEIDIFYLLIAKEGCAILACSWFLLAVLVSCDLSVLWNFCRCVIACSGTGFVFVFLLLCAHLLLILQVVF